ncbi:hypothetical protein LINPERPRIM_LOCUS40856 [Linum perenne]
MADLENAEVPVVHFTEEDLREARERSELSLVARIFWDEPRELRAVENSFIPVWKCGRVRVFDVGFGLYQFIFPTVSKRNWVFENQPWFFQRSIIHFSQNMMPSEELFLSLQFMLIWVKITGMPFACLTKAIGRKLLEPLGEVLKVGYYDAGTPEGTYVKGRVRMDLFEPFVGTAPAVGSNGAAFTVFFSYVDVPCICYLCGFLGHFMADCPRTDLVFDENVRGDWISIPADPNEKEEQGSQLQQVQVTRAPGRRGGGLPPAVAAGLSSNLLRQRGRGRALGGAVRRNGPTTDANQPCLAITWPGPIQPPEPNHRIQSRVGPAPISHSARPLRSISPSRRGGSGPTRSVGSRLRPSLSGDGDARSAGPASHGRGPIGDCFPAAPRSSLVAALTDRGKKILGPVLSPALSAAGEGDSKEAPAGAVAEVDMLGSTDGPAQPNPHNVPACGIGSSSARTSTPSTGSVKRKLLLDFENDDVASADCFAEPFITHTKSKLTDGPGMSTKLVDANEDQFLGVRPEWVVSVEGNDANFDPDALFASGSEEGEINDSDHEDDEPTAEVASQNRPPMVK